MSLEWPSVLAWLHGLYILEENLGDLKFWGHWKVVKYIIAKTRRECQFWLIFKIKLDIV